MPSLNDFFTELTTVNNRLQTVHDDLVALTAETTAVRTSMDNGFNRIDATLTAGFTAMSQGAQALITLQTFTNAMLVHHAHQHDTMICSLDQISRNTCSIFNEAHVQTGLQAATNESVGTSAEIEKHAHPDAALELERHAELRQQVEACCPPEEPPPACTFEPCEPPKKAGKPPKVDYSPFEPRRNADNPIR